MAYDSRSDHLTYGELFGEGSLKPHALVNSQSRKVKRTLKRIRSKANRRRARNPEMQPFTQMRGYGWGNYNYRNWD